MVGDGTWLSTGEVVELHRAAGWADSESTIRREVDDAIAAGYLRSYRTRGAYRRVRAEDVRAWIAAKKRPPHQRDIALEELRRRNRGDENAPPGGTPGGAGQQ